MALNSIQWLKTVGRKSRVENYVEKSGKPEKQFIHFAIYLENIKHGEKGEPLGGMEIKKTIEEWKDFEKGEENRKG